jgi:hypothetical protein
LDSIRFPALGSKWEENASISNSQSILCGSVATSGRQVLYPIAEVLDLVEKLGQVIMILDLTTRI